MSFRRMIRLDDANNVLLGTQVLGDLVATESGYYEFFPDLSRGGFWPSWLLREIANTVDHKNSGWDAEVAKYFAEHQELEPYEPSL